MAARRVTMRQRHQNRALMLEGVRRDRERAKLAESTNAMAPFMRDPHGWIAGYVPELELTPYQDDVFALLGDADRLSVRGPHGLGKCVDASDDVRVADGRWVRAGDLIGKSFEVLAWDECTGVVAPASARAVDNGLRRIVEIETVNGRVLRRTEDHPLWGDANPGRWDATQSAVRVRPMGSWVAASDLRAGSVVACAMGQDRDDTSGLSDAEAVVVACLIADGHTKRVPDGVWRMSATRIADFVGFLWACDGWATATARSDGRTNREIGYTSTSRLLCVDVQRLLASIGVQSHLSRRSTSWVHRGVPRTGVAWTVGVRTPRDITSFASLVDVPGKRDAVEAVAATCTGSKECQTWQTNGAPDGFVWERVRSVRLVDSAATVSIEVPSVQTFVADVLEHNTMIAAGTILWFAVTRELSGFEWKIITTSGSHFQLRAFLWPEVRKWARRVDWVKLGIEPWDGRQMLRTGMTLHYGQAMSASPNRAELIEGAHEDHLLYIFDEAKRLDVDTAIPTPTGWTKMGCLQVGDQVLDENGKPCNVTYRSKVEPDAPCVRVTFSDGSSIVADQGHLWAHLAARKRQSRGAAVSDWRDHWDHADVVETSELSAAPGDRSAIPLARPLDLPEVALRVDPYTLGAWLGDGSSYHGVIHSADPEVAEISDLKHLNVVQNKHIPAEYLRASETQRRALLAGLMDTDGTSMSVAGVRSPRVSFTSTRRALADGVAELVRTLGCRTTVTESRAMLNGDDYGPCWIVRWSADRCPFALERKAARWEPRSAQASAATILTVVSVTPTISVPTMCIAVDSPRRMYLAGESMVPTHNSIPSATFDAAEGAFSGAGGEGRTALALALSTPGDPIGRFYDIQSRKPGTEDWAVRHVTLDEAVAADRINQKWIDDRGRQWGKDSAVYRQRVMGEFAASDEDGVVPLSWVEAAVERWQAWHMDHTDPPDGPGRVGVDVARGGGDKTMIARTIGRRWVGELEAHDVRDTMPIVGFMAAAIAGVGYGVGVVDVIGVGAGVYDRAREQNMAVEAFVASGKSEATDRSGELGFVNKRAAAWWQLREQLDPAFEPTLMLPPDDELLGDLTSPRYKLTSGGKIQIEAKDEMRKRLGRSPDRADAVIMALFVDEATALQESAGFSDGWGDGPAEPLSW